MTIQARHLEVQKGMQRISKQLAESLHKSSLIRKMFEFGIVLKRQYGEENILDFSIGNPILEPPKELKERIISILNEDRPGLHRYMSNAGFQSTREVLGAYLRDREGLPFSEKNIIMTSGAAAGVNIILKTLLDPGDEVIILAPYFSEYIFYTRNAGGTVIVSETDDNFIPDLAELERKITEKTKLLIINTPHNPTGRIYEDHVLKGIADVLSRASRKYGHSIFLLNDEPYRKLIYDGIALPSVMKHYPNSFCVVSHSKDLGLAGERIGYIYFHPQMDCAELIFEAMKFVNRVLGFVNAPALFQKAIETAQNLTVDIGFYARKRDLLYSELTRIGYKLIKPEGAFFMFPKSPLPDDVAFANLCLEEKLIVVPGTSFGRAGYFRLCYSVTDATVARAIPVFERLYDQAQQISEALLKGEIYQQEQQEGTIPCAALPGFSDVDQDNPEIKLRQPTESVDGRIFYRA